jgi:hypothetical protein
VHAASNGGRGDTRIDLEVHGLPMRASTPREVVQQLRRAARFGVVTPHRRVGWESA